MDDAVHRSRDTTRAVKDLILTRKLRPGDPMPTEAELMDMLQVSRSKIREAIRTLVALDILEVRHGTGTFVGQLSLQPLVEALAFKSLLLPGQDLAVLRQIVGVRAALDQALAPEVVHRLTGETASELHGLCDRMRQAAPRGEDFAEADRSFHLLLGKTLGNPLHGQLIAAFWDVHTIVTPGLGIGTTRDTVDSARAHLKIVEAAVAGDLEGYRAAVDAHYAPLLRALDTSEKQEPGDNDTLDAP
ncbi:MAG TPA: FadR family transcriptional regulator [Propionibacterium sp.]|jgi:DNA-binding FadR family transcriptional regulator|nr:FadR family transcriptional regulator [Propionibacterium sp.]